VLPQTKEGLEPQVKHHEHNNVKQHFKTYKRTWKEIAEKRPRHINWLMLTRTATAQERARHCTPCTVKL